MLKCWRSSRKAFLLVATHLHHHFHACRNLLPPCKTAPLTSATRVVQAPCRLMKCSLVLWSLCTAKWWAATFVYLQLFTVVYSCCRFAWMCTSFHHKKLASYYLVFLWFCPVMRVRRTSICTNMCGRKCRGSSPRFLLPKATLPIMHKTGVYLPFPFTLIITQFSVFLVMIAFATNTLSHWKLYRKTEFPVLGARGTGVFHLFTCLRLHVLLSLYQVLPGLQVRVQCWFIQLWQLVHRHWLGTYCFASPLPAVPGKGKLPNLSYCYSW
jgi:hypothetical protein